LKAYNDFATNGPNITNQEFAGSVVSF